MTSSFQNFVTLSTSNGMVLPLNQINMNNNAAVSGKAGEFTVIRKKQRVTPLGVSNTNVQPTLTASNAKRTVIVKTIGASQSPGTKFILQAGGAQVSAKQLQLHQQPQQQQHPQQQQQQVQPQKQHLQQQKPQQQQQLQQQKPQQRPPPQQLQKQPQRPSPQQQILIHKQNLQLNPPQQLNQLENIPPPQTGNARAAKTPSLPVSVARRNARERNRVKQVNNGFAALRERIPDEVAEVFESIGNGRGSVKKLSKVETLRMAVEYIRSLEQCLADDGAVPLPPQPYLSMGSPDGMDSDFNCSATMLNTTTPPPESSELGDETLNLDDTDLSEISYLDQTNSGQIPGSQQGFIRLPTGGSFQISTPIYEANENVRTLRQPFQVLDPATGFLHVSHHHADDMHPMMSPAASISPHSYDDQSLPDIKTEPCYVIVTPEQQQQMGAGLSTVYYTTTPVGGVDSTGFDGMLTMKTEVVDDEDSREMLMTEQEHADSMIGESLQWWQKTDQQRLGTTS